jgi:hypothetical protein
MSRRALARSIAKAKPIISRGTEAVLQEPLDPWEAILWAKAHQCLRERHFERLCQVHGPVLREVLIANARHRRVERLTHGTPYEPGRASQAAIEVLSFRPEEPVPIQCVRTIEIDSQVPFRILAHPKFSKGGYFRDCMKGLLIIRILGTTDALGLREDIWSGV